MADPMTWDEARRAWAALPPARERAIIVVRRDGEPVSAARVAQEGGRWIVREWIYCGWWVPGHDTLTRSSDGSSWIASKRESWGDYMVGRVQAEDLILIPDDDTMGERRLAALMGGLRLVRWVEEQIKGVESYNDLRQLAALLDPDAPCVPVSGAARSAGREPPVVVAWPDCLAEWTPTVLRGA